MAELASIPTWTKARSEVALAVRDGDQERADRARAALKAAKLRDHIEQVVNSAPPLTAEQRDRLALILRPAPVADPEQVA